MTFAAIQRYALTCGLLLVPSWLMLILFPASAWSTSALGFAAPAYTPFLWLLGIALLGRQLFWGTFYRIGDIRVFYDVTEAQVQVLAVVTKAEADAWLKEHGKPTKDDAESRGSGRSEG